MRLRHSILPIPQCCTMETDHDDDNDENELTSTAIMERAREEMQPADMVRALKAHFKVFAKLRSKTLHALLRRNKKAPSSLHKLFAGIVDTGMAITRMACVQFMLPSDQTKEICSTIISLTTSNEVGDDDTSANTENVDAELVAELDDLRAGLDGAHADLDNARAHLDDREAELERAYAKLDQARAMLEKKETRIVSLQEEVDRERERRRGEVDRYEERFRAERDRCDEMEVALRRARQVEVSSSSGELQSKLDELAESKRLSDEAIQMLTEQLADMTRERDELQLKCEVGESEKQALHEKVRHLEDRLQQRDVTGIDSGALGHERCDATDDESNAGALDYPAGIKRNNQGYKRRVQQMRKDVVDWPGADVSWANLIGVLIQIIKWRYIEAPGNRPTSRYKSFQSTSVAFVAFFVAYGVGQVVSNVALNEDEQDVVFENIDLIVAEIKQTCDKDIIFDNANVLAINAKKHVPAIWQKLEDVKRSGQCVWSDSTEARKSKKNLHIRQLELYESLFIEMKERQQIVDAAKQIEDTTSACKVNSRDSSKKNDDDDVIVIE